MSLVNEPIEYWNRQIREVRHFQVLDDVPIVARAHHGASEPSAKESVHVTPQFGLGDLHSN